MEKKQETEKEEKKQEEQEKKQEEKQEHKEEEKKEDREREDEEIKVDPKFEKIVSEIEKMSIMDLAELVKILEKKFGVSAAVAVAASSSADGSSDEDEKSSYNVLLKESGSQKINVIKAVKEITGLGLKESKELVDNVPSKIKENIKKEEAEEMKKKLEEAGAKAELQ